jgi:hypothetical protein
MTEKTTKDSGRKSDGEEVITLWAEEEEDRRKK